LRGIIKVGRKGKVVGVVCVVFEVKGPQREGRESACLFTDSQPTTAVILGRVSEH
jgi:hypothetical protein